MPKYRYCAVAGCGNMVGPKAKASYKETLHCFPNKDKHPEAHEFWIKFCGRQEGWKAGKSHFICHCHFMEKSRHFAGHKVKLPCRFPPASPKDAIHTMAEQMPLDPSDNLLGFVELLPSGTADAEVEEVDEAQLIYTLPVLPTKDNMDVRLECDNGLPRERTPEVAGTSGESVEELIRKTVQANLIDDLILKQALTLTFANVPLARLPARWMLLSLQLDYVLFAEVDPLTTEIPRQVAVLTSLDVKIRFSGLEYDGKAFEQFFPLSTLEMLELLLASIAGAKRCLGQPALVAGPPKAVTSNPSTGIVTIPATPSVVAATPVKITEEDDKPWRPRWSAKCQLVAAGNHQCNMCRQEYKKFKRRDRNRKRTKNGKVKVAEEAPCRITRVFFTVEPAT